MLIPVLLAFLTLGAAVAVYAFAVEPAWLRLRRRTLHVPGWHPSIDGLTILHLSDLHVGRSNARLARFMRRAADVAADVVVITGDFIDRPEHLPGLLEVLQPVLHGPRPVIGILGNHDRYVYKDRRRRGASVAYDSADLIEALQNAGIELLIDSSVEIETANGPVTFAGVDVRSHSDEGVAAAIAGADLAKTVLLAHSPDIHAPAMRAGVRLVLAGHTHGGQVRVGPWITPTTSTHRPIKPPSGLHTSGGTLMHVSPGLGTTMLPLRFFSRPEATVVQVWATEKPPG